MNQLTDRSAPGVRLSVLASEHSQGGEPLDLGGRLVGLTFEDSESRTDKLSLQLDNFDLSLFEHPDLAGGTLLEVSWGYPGHMAPPRRVVVRKLKGFEVLTVECQSLAVLLNQESRTRSWQNATRAEVARQVASEHGYEGVMVDVQETGERFDTIHQSAETDAQLLRRLASREEYEFYVDNGGFHFHERRQHVAPSQVFTWYTDPGRGDVLSIQVESDLGRRVGRVTVRGRDPMNRSNIEVSATNESVERSTLGEVIEVVDPETGQTHLETRNATSSSHSSSASSEGQAQREADARYRRAERGTVKLAMRVVGDPSVRAKSIVEVRGISSLLSGLYYVTEARHVISAGGYTCDLKLTRDGTGRRARQLAQELEGERNEGEAGEGDELTEVEVVDPETGETYLEYREVS